MIPAPNALGLTVQTRAGRYRAVCLHCGHTFRVDYVRRSQALELLDVHALEQHGPRGMTP